MDQQRYRSRAGLRRLVLGKTAVWTALVCLAALALTLAYFASRPKGSDADQVKAALAESLKASREGRPGGVLDKLSAAFQVNQQVVSSGQVAKAIKKYQPSVDVTNPNPIVTDDVAHVVSPMAVTVNLLGASQEFTMQNVDIEFHRETGHAWLIFPVSTWRLTAIHLPEDAAAKFAAFGQMGGF